MDDQDRSSDTSMDQQLSWDSSTNHVENSGSRFGPRMLGREMSASLSVVGRLAEELEQRKQVFADDAKFLVEVKSGQVEASLNPDRELRRLKQNFEFWKKDFGVRLRETKVILNKLGADEVNSDSKLKRKWWGRLNSSKII